MSVESSARIEFGILIKRNRAENGWKREKFAKLIGVSPEVIKRLEHGVPNPTRPELVRAIKVLQMSKKDLIHAYKLLRIFSPRKKQRIKFHLNICGLRHRNRNRNQYCYAA